MLSPFRWFASLENDAHSHVHTPLDDGGDGDGDDGDASVRTLVTGWGGIGAPASEMNILRNVSLGLSLKYPRYPITTKFESSTVYH